MCLVDYKELIEASDTSMKQMLFFYELCKLGVVRFDLTNKAHADILINFIEMLSKYDESKFQDQSEHYIRDMRNRHQLRYLIVVNILAHAEPPINLNLK